MKKKSLFFMGIIMLIAASFMLVGYSNFTDSLYITGSANATPHVYDTIIVTDVTTLGESTITQEKHYAFPSTAVKTVISGSAGQKIVYKITAHNYSKTETYIFNGIKYTDAYSGALSKMSISLSRDLGGEDSLPLSPTSEMFISGTAVAPGEDFVFYAVYTLQKDMTAEELLLNYSFDDVIYSVTYLTDNETWAVDHIIDNSKTYNVRGDGPDKDGRKFEDWINASANPVGSYPAGNTNSYTLSAKWEELYLIIFVDDNGTVLYQETFTSSSSALSSAGQQIVSQKLAELQSAAAKDDMTVKWSDYTIKGAKANIVVHPIYTYTGNLQFTPVDTDGDGITNYYQIDAVSKLNNPTKIPGEYNGLPVEVVNKLYRNENNLDYGAGVKRIEVGEGVKTLNPNALAYTSDLTEVKLPSTIEYIGKNAFSRNFASDKKKLIIEFNGTIAEWREIVSNSHDEWHNGLKTGSQVRCSDGYFELDRGFLELGGYNWKQKSY